MRTATMDVMGGVVREPIIGQEPPRRDEPSKTTPQRGASFVFRAIMYENKWTPIPELIPAVLRFTRTGRGIRQPKTNVQRSMSGSGMIQREIPSSYSEQIMG